MTRRGLRRWVAAVAAGALALASASASASPPARPASACPPLAANVAAADTAGSERDRGLLWRLTRDGRTSYLYGTLHVGKPGWRRLGPQLDAALSASDVLALEVDPGDPALPAALAEWRRDAELPAALAVRLERAFARACVAPQAMAGLHPVLQAATLTMLEARWLGMDPGHATENWLGNEARARGRRVVPLETAAQQKAALVPDNDAEAQAMIEHSLQQLEDQRARRVLARLAAAWETGDLATLDDFAAWCECAADESDRAFMRRLNDERNAPLADAIEALHREGHRVLAAVGALHMTGPQSLPRLLAARGFGVERVAFSR